MPSRSGQCCPCPGHERFAVGSLVRARKGTVSPDRPDLPLGGWCGTVPQVGGGLRLVRWSEATLETVRSLGNQTDDAMWLQEAALEADPGEPLCLEYGNPLDRKDCSSATDTNDRERTMS